MKDRLNQLLANTGDIALKRRAKWLIENLKLENGQQILDIGCGDGFYLHLLSNLTFKLKITGLDNDENALKSARSNLRGKKVILICDNAKTLPFRSNTFDRVIASEVLEHIDNDIAALNEIKRVLKPEGIIVLSVPHSNYPFLWDPVNWLLERFFDIHIKKGFWAGIWNQHKRLYSKKKLELLIKKAGLSGSHVEKFTHYSLPFNHYLINIIARYLAWNKSNKKIKRSLSKFSTSKHKENSNLNFFSILNIFDRLNDNWGGKGSSVSLVAYAKKN